MLKLKQVGLVFLVTGALLLPACGARKAVTGDGGEATGGTDDPTTGSGGAVGTDPDGGALQTGGTGGEDEGGAGTGGAGGQGGDTDAGSGGMAGSSPNDGGGGVPAPSVCAGGGLPPLHDDPTVYATQNLDVWTVRVTAPDAAALADVNNNVAGAHADVIFQEGTFGSAATQPNAVMEIAGHTTRLSIQKSYQITLTSKQETWRGYRKINLNKHPYDLTRVRNKLAFDLFQNVPGFSSLRTQFVHLLVNDQDYGLYTQIEAPDDRSLAAHGFDANGALYKANAFYWEPIDDATAADPMALDMIVESHGKPEIDRLNRTIRDAADMTQDINDIVRRHFERQNYLTWLAVDILFGNFDTGTQNYFLYSPEGCDGWYFMPWDYDGSLEFYQQPGQPPIPRWRAGLANWWWVPLHQRFVRDPNNFRDLDAMVTQLYQQVLTDDAAAMRAASYRETVRAFISVAPDVWNLPAVMPASKDEAVMQWETEYARLNGVIGRRYADYRASLGRPMPVWLYTPTPPATPGGTYTFSWSPSFMLGDGGDFSYDLEISTTTAFAPADLVVQQRGLRQAIAMVTVPPGSYYWRVIIRPDANPDVDWQIPFSQYQKFDVAP